MSFWNVKGVDARTEASGTFESGNGFEPIPNNTKALAMIDNIKWNTDDNGVRSIRVTWTILKPSEYANRKIWQTLYPADLNPHKEESKALEQRAKDIVKLANMDFNAGKKMALNDREPTDDDLAASLQNKSMVIQIMFFRDRNYIDNIYPSNKPVEVGTEKPVMSNQSAADITGDSIPF